MTATTPTLTIGLPVYNGARHLEKSVDSILRQTFTDFRLVISDNGSTDGTTAIMARLAERDSRVEARYSPVNRGAAWNYNTLAEDVDSPLFKWIAHDDIHHPEYLERCIAVLQAEPAVVAAHTRARYIDDRDAEVSRCFRQESFGDTSPSSRMRGVLNSHHDHTFAFSVMRTSVLRDVRPFRPGFVSDGIFLCEFALRGRMVQLPEHLFDNRLHVTRSVAENPGRGGKLSYQSWWGGANHRIDRSPTWAATEQLMSAVARSPVTGAERRRCFAAAAGWGGRRWRALAVEAPRRVAAVRGT